MKQEDSTIVKPISELQDVLLKVLRSFHEFCEEHNLTYYLSDGTLLGAIREGGFIPWDDDVDVSMPRADYNRLLSLADNLEDPYQLGHIKLDGSYVYPFLKFYDMSTSVIEHLQSMQYKSGVWLDIFPLDGTYENLVLRKLHYKTLNVARKIFYLRFRPYIPLNASKTQSTYWIKSFLKRFVFVFLKMIPKKIIHSCMDKIARHLAYDKATIIGNLYTYIGIKASHEKVWFKERILVDFEGDAFYAPVGYHGYLTNLYGDYMTPLPPEERVPHSVEIVSLGE